MDRQFALSSIDSDMEKAGNFIQKIENQHMVSQQHLKTFSAALIINIPSSHKPRLEPLLGLGVDTQGQTMRWRCTPQDEVPVQETAEVLKAVGR